MRPGNVFSYGAVSGLKHGLAHELQVLQRLQKSQFSGSLLFSLLKASPGETELKELLNCIGCYLLASRNDFSLEIIHHFLRGIDK